MNETLRALSLGAVHLFGIAVPGFLLIFLASIGLFVPALAMALHFSHPNWGVVISFYERNQVLIVSMLLLLSYIAGYILRLSSPDELDQESAKHALRQMDDNERRVWPYQGKEGDRFPYFHFREYLEARGLHHLAEHVKWGPPGASDRSKRSKTAVNAMKLDILLHQPNLASVVDSNEAHIRLMSGTWLAIRYTQSLLLVGAVFSLIGMFVTYAPGVRSMLHLDSSDFNAQSAPYYPVLFVLSLSMLAAAVWARFKIESLFHYRRVNELLFILMAADIAREQQDSVSEVAGGVTTIPGLNRTDTALSRGPAG